MQIEKRTVRVNGEPIHYGVVGVGEPIVLIHGLSGSWTWWRRNVPALAQRYQVYLIDLPGFGAMRRFASQFELERSALWLAGWLEVVGLEGVNLVGHSMGGYICMATAAAHAEKVKRLVLVDSIGAPFGELAARWIFLALKSIVRTTPMFWPYIAYDYLRAGTRMVARAAGQIRALDTASAIAGIAVPTLLIWGARDDLIPLHLGQQLHARIAGSRLVVFPQSNHFPMFDHPREFNAELLAFLASEEISGMGRA